MDLWAPKIDPSFDFKKLDLAREEAFILYQLDGNTTVQNLVHLSGLPKARVREILLKLHLAGVLEAEGTPDDIIRDKRLIVEGLIETDESFVVEGLEPAPERVVDDDDEFGFGERLVTEEQLAAEELAVLREKEAIASGEVRPPALPQRPAARTREVDDTPFREVTSEDLGGEALDQVRGGRVEKEPELPPEDPDDVRAKRVAKLRRLFRQEFASMTPGQRMVLAREAEGDRLSALCFDPEPATTNAVLNNPNVSVIHYRLLAAQARNPLILDLLADHPVYGRDVYLRRYLLGNMRGSDALYQRLFGLMAMGEIALAATGGDLSERAKRAGFAALHKLYQGASAEERLALVLDTDGACLHSPFSLNLDTRTSELLIGAEITSLNLANNLARCRSTPTSVIRHLLHSALGRSSLPLRNLLQQHPNARR